MLALTLLFSALCHLATATKMQAIYVDKTTFPTTQPGISLPGITSLVQAKTRCAEIAARMGSSTFQLEHFSTTQLEIRKGSICHVAEIDRRFTINDVNPRQLVLMTCDKNCSDPVSYEVHVNYALQNRPKPNTKPLYRATKLPTAKYCMDLGTRELRKTYFDLYDPSELVVEWKVANWTSSCTFWRQSDFAKPMNQVAKEIPDFSLGLLAPLDVEDRHIRNMACTSRHLDEVLAPIGCVEIPFDADGVVQNYDNLIAEFGPADKVLETLPHSKMTLRGDDRQRGGLRYYETNYVTSGAVPVHRNFKAFKVQEAVSICDQLAKNHNGRMALLTYRLTGYQCTVYFAQMQGVSSTELDPSLIYGWLWAN